VREQRAREEGEVTVPDGATVTEAGVAGFDPTGLPIPESLLAPLLDVAATTLAGYERDIPAVLRPLTGFDPKRLRSGPARQQLRRALDVDAAFRERVATRFVERPEVITVLETWSAGGAARRVEEAAERSDLALLASALFAARPEGFEFGLGLTCAAFDRQRREKERDDDAKARDTQLAILDEARRRADTARDAAQRDLDRLETQLRDERRLRRERELKADRAVEDAARRRQDAEAAVARAEGVAAEAQQRAARESERAREAEARLRALRRERAAAAREHREPSGGLSDEEVHALGEAARDAARLAARLEALATRPAPTSASRSGDPRPTRSSARVRVPCPPGMRADTADALDVMLRNRGVQLVVDGYNVSMAGWRDDHPSDQRDRLLRALERLHLRLRTDVTVVFDGADVEGGAGPRRPGVRVIFTSAGEEADPVVVREVERLPVSTPAIVASSDRWVREHAEAVGATVVPAEALLDVLRR
jgi:predicted RNA-binding protein with PIN domain